MFFPSSLSLCLSSLPSPYPLSTLSLPTFVLLSPCPSPCPPPFPFRYDGATVYSLGNTLLSLKTKLSAMAQSDKNMNLIYEDAIKDESKWKTFFVDELSNPPGLLNVNPIGVVDDNVDKTVLISHADLIPSKVQIALTVRNIVRRRERS